MEMTGKLRKPLLYLLTALMVLTCVVAYSPADLGAKAAVTNNKDVLIVIDPGRIYGATGADPGYKPQTTSGITEADLNKKLSANIALALQNKGYTVMTTLDVGNGIPNLIENKKPNITLQQRYDAANDVQASLFISVHMNSYGTYPNKASGASVYYDSAQTATNMALNSQNFAKAVYNYMSTLTGVKGDRTTPVTTKGEAVLRYNKAPAIMLEAGFLTNQTDLMNLVTDNYRINMASKVADGVANFLTSYTPPKRDTTPPTIGELRTSKTPAYNSKFNIAAYSVEDTESGVKRVYCGVFPKGKRKTQMKYVEAKYQGGAKWVAKVDIKALFDNRAGRYFVEVYAVDNAGNVSNPNVSPYEDRVLVQYLKDTKPPVLSTVKVNKTPSKTGRISIAAYGVKDEQSGVKNVQYKVYPSGKRHKGTTAINAKKSGSKWSATVNLKKLYKKTGRYVIDIYGTDKAGNTGLMKRVKVVYTK